MSDNLRFKKNLLETFDPVSGIMYQLRMGSVATNTTILSSVVSSMIMGASHADGEFGFEFDVYDAQGTNDAYLNYLVRYNSNQGVKVLNIVTIKDTETSNPMVVLNADQINFDTFSTGAAFGGVITDISYISSQSISTNVLSSGSAYVGSLTGSNISTINFQADKLDVRTINVINVSTFTLSTQSVITNSISTMAISSGTATLGTTTASSLTANSASFSTLTTSTIVGSSAHFSTLTTSGNIGIGTSNPITSLHISTGTINSGILIEGAPNVPINFKTYNLSNVTDVRQATISLKGGQTDKALQFWNYSSDLSSNDIAFNWLNNNIVSIMNLTDNGALVAQGQLTTPAVSTASISTASIVGSSARFSGLSTNTISTNSIASVTSQFSSIVANNMFLTNTSNLQTLLNFGFGNTSTHTIFRPGNTSNLEIFNYGIGYSQIAFMSNGPIQFANNGAIITSNGALPASVGNQIFWATGYASPTSGRFIFGDGTGWRMHFSRRIGSVTTDLVTFQDNGALVAQGQLTTPAVSTSVISTATIVGNTGTFTDLNLLSPTSATQTGLLFRFSTLFTHALYRPANSSDLRVYNYTNSSDQVSFNANGSVDFAGGELTLTKASFPAISIRTTSAGTYRGSIYWDHINNQMVFDNPGNAYPIYTQGSELKSFMHVPAVNNTYSIGDGTRRWTEVFAVNGTINTSDERLKTEISTTTLGLEFIKSLRPVNYKWIEGQKKPIKDLSGAVIEYESIPGERIHHGFIAQEVKQVLDNYGINSALWILTDKENPESEQGLRYGEFIAPLVKSVQELNSTINLQTIILNSTSLTVTSQSCEISTMKSQMTVMEANISTLMSRIQ